MGERKARIEYRSIQGYKFLIAETDISSRSYRPRSHRRVVVVSPQDASLYGKTVLYSDCYLGPGDPETYLYMRHRVQPEAFLLALDYLIEEQRHNVAELGSRSFYFMLNVGGTLLEEEFAPPFSVHMQMKRDIRFVRISLPFGDVCIEFGEQRVRNYREPGQVGADMLTTAFDSPLFGFDASKSTMLSVLAARIHWAAGRIPVEVLEDLIAEVPIPV